VKLYIYPVI